MTFQRAQYRDWIEQFLEPHYPELVAPFLAALEAFEAAIEAGALNDAALETIVECARSSRMPLGENAATLLGQLVARFPAAEHAVRGMAVHPKVHVRVNALVALSSTPPASLHDEVLRMALRDRSSKIRALAADKIMQFELDHLLPELDAATASENVPKTREELEYARDLLRDGYRVRPLEDGRAWLSCRMPDGALMSSVVDAKDLQAKGAKAIARSLGAKVRGG